MSRLREYAARKGQESQQVLSNITTEHKWATATYDKPLALSIVAGNTQARIAEYFSPWGTYIANSITINFNNIYYTSRNVGNYEVNRGVFDIVSPSLTNITAATITFTRPATLLDAGGAYLYGLNRLVAGQTNGADWSRFTTVFSSLTAYDNVTDSITFTLNAAGLAHINAGNVSFMIRGVNDVEDYAPITSQSIELFTGFSGSVTYPYSPVTVNDGLIGTITDSGTGSLVALSQVDPYRPQWGLDKTGDYRASTVPDGLVLSLTNSADSTTRKLPTITGVSGTSPTKAGGYLEFAQGKSLSRTTVAQTIAGFTLVAELNLPIFSGVSGVQYFDIFSVGDTTNGIRLLVYFSTSSNIYYLEAVLYRAGGTTYTYYSAASLAAFNATVCGSLKTVIVTKGANYFAIEIDNALLRSVTDSGATITTTSGATSTIINTLPQTCKIRRIRAYLTTLTATEKILLIANRDNESYELSKQSIVSTGTSYLQSAAISANSVVANMVVSCWVYLQNVLDYATQADQQLICTSGFVNPTDKGFQLKVQKDAGGNAYFRATIGNGTTLAAVNSSSLPIATFRTNYTGRWFKVAITVYSSTSCTLTLFADTGNLGSNTTSLGAYNSGSGILNVGQLSTSVNNIGAGNKVAIVKLENSKTIDATEFARSIIQDKIDFPFLTTT